MPVLSIVITVYNKADFVQRCLASCLQQAGEDCEVIAVNDGSTDASLQLLRQYAAKDSRLKIIDQENAGLSLAREKGAAAATGSNLWFVDADDYLSEGAVGKVLEALQDGCDVLCLQARTEGECEARAVVPSSFTQARQLLCSDLFEDCVPFYVFRRAFLQENRLHFFPGIYHEDAEFTPRMLYAASALKVCPEVLYRVYPDSRSMARLPKVRRAYDLVTVAEHLWDFCRREVKEKDCRKVFCHRASKALNNALDVICCFGEEEQSAFNTFLRQHADVLSVLGKSQAKYRLEGLLFRMFPGHCVNVYRRMKRR